MRNFCTPRDSTNVYECCQAVYGDLVNFDILYDYGIGAPKL